MTLENMQLHHLLANKRFLVTPADFLVIRSLQVFADTSITSARTFLEKKRH